MGTEESGSSLQVLGKDTSRRTLTKPFDSPTFPCLHVHPLPLCYIRKVFQSIKPSVHVHLRSGTIDVVGHVDQLRGRFEASPLATRFPVAEV